MTRSLHTPVSGGALHDGGQADPLGLVPVAGPDTVGSIPATLNCDYTLNLSRCDSVLLSLHFQKSSRIWLQASSAISASCTAPATDS